jgi:hypothetical protein
MWEPRNAYSEPLGARKAGSGSIPTSVQRSDSGEAVAAREFSDRLGVARSEDQPGDVGTLAGGVAAQQRLQVLTHHKAAPQLP